MALPSGSTTNPGNRKVDSDGRLLGNLGTGLPTGYTTGPDNLKFDSDGRVLLNIDTGIPTSSISAATRQLLEGVINVKDPLYGAVGDGVADDTTPLQNAINAAQTQATSIGDFVEVFLPAGVYLANNLTISSSHVRVVGPGCIKKNANGPVFTVSAQYVEFHRVHIAGSGATYTGNGITVSTANDFKFTRGVIDDIDPTGGYCIEYTASVYVRKEVSYSFLQLRGAPLRAAIAYPSTPEVTGSTAIIGCDCGGGDLVDLRGAASVTIMGNFCRLLYSDTNTINVKLIGNRFANPSNTLTLSGQELMLIGNAIGGNVTFDTTTKNCRAVGNRVAGGFTMTDNGTDNSNELFDIFVHPTTNILALGQVPKGAPNTRLELASRGAGTEPLQLYKSGATTVYATLVDRGTGTGGGGGFRVYDQTGTLQVQMDAQPPAGGAAVGGRLLFGSLSDTSWGRIAAAVVGTNESDIATKGVGKGLRVAEGSNAKQGTATLSAGAAVVSNTAVTASSRIQLTVQSLGTVTAPKAIAVTARTAGTSFTITSSDNTDTSVVAYEIFEPA